MSVFRTVERVHVDTYVDNYDFPHRKLTARELNLLFTIHEEKAEGYYLKRDIELFRPVEQGRKLVAELKDQVDNNPRYAQLVDLNTAVCERFEDATEESKPALRTEQREIYAELAAIKAPLVAAQADLQKAEHEYDRLRMEFREAQIIMGLQAGQREGLRLGLEVAALLLAGAPVAQIEHAKAALLVAGAMTNDGQADALVGTLLQAEIPTN